MIIRGNTVGTTALRADWNETNETKSSFISGKAAVDAAIGAARQEAARHSADRENPHAVTCQQLGAAAEIHSHTAAQVGAVTEAQVLQILQNQLGVIENGTY